MPTVTEMYDSAGCVYVCNNVSLCATFHYIKAGITHHDKLAYIETLATP